MNRRIVLAAVVVVAIATAIIATRLLASESTPPALARIDGYATTAVPNQLMLRVDLATQAVILGETIIEDSEKVVISIRIKKPPGFDQGRFELTTITLKAPLGSRRVIDGLTGSAVSGQ